MEFWVIMCVCVGVCDVGWYFDRDVDGVWDNLVFCVDVVVEFYVEGGEVWGGGVDYCWDGIVDVCGYESW